MFVLRAAGEGVSDHLLVDAKVKEGSNFRSRREQVKNREVNEVRENSNRSRKGIYYQGKNGIKKDCATEN